MRVVPGGVQGLDKRDVFRARLRRPEEPER
jgi:hypothetical protein